MKSWLLHREYKASGHDMHSLLFNFLDELLFVFSTELFVPVELRITKFDRSEWRIRATGCALLCGACIVGVAAPILMSKGPASPALSSPVGRG